MEIISQILLFHIFYIITYHDLVSDRTKIETEKVRKFNLRSKKNSKVQRSKNSTSQVLKSCKRRFSPTSYIVDIKITMCTLT